MRGPRLAAFVLATLVPPVAYRLGGVGLWTLTTAGLTVAAALSAYTLWQDEELRDLITPRSLDISWGVAGAAVLYCAAALVFFNLAAPIPELRSCGVHGPIVVRGDAAGITRVWEWVRSQTCAGYSRTLGLVGPVRGALVILLAVLEEITWRGGVQQALAERLGSTRGWLCAVVLNTLAVAAMGNPLLVPIALGGSLLWGGLYRYRGRLAPAIASHAVFSFFLFHQMPLVAMR